MATRVPPGRGEPDPPLTPRHPVRSPMSLASEKSAPPRRSPSFVVLICFVSIVFDGYDLVVYGTTIPSILAYQEWEVTPEQAGAIGSYALMGMLIGTLTVGAITDILGRRKIMLLSITWFSAAMGLSALSTSPEMLGVLRFVAGLGLGGVVGTIAASRLADRIGIKPVAASAFGTATLSILLLSVNFPLALLLL